MRLLLWLQRGAATETLLEQSDFKAGRDYRYYSVSILSPTRELAMQNADRCNGSPEVCDGPSARSTITGSWTVISDLFPSFALRCGALDDDVTWMLLRMRRLLLARLEAYVAT